MVAQSYDRNADPHRRLRNGSRGEDVKRLQTAMNLRLSRRGLAEIDVDGEVGPQTLAAFARLRPFLGFRHNWLTVNHQRFTRWPWHRPADMKKRGEEYLKKHRSIGGGPGRAVRWAAQYAGKVKENPPGSNRGGLITQWQTNFGRWLIGLAWCGVFVGNALRAAGVKGVNFRVASVAFIEDDAKAGRNGFASWHRPRSGRPGDAVILFGRGVHVELIEKVLSGGYQTIGGNTSSGNSGSQSNGGGVYRRVRPFGNVRGCARPRY